MVEERDISVHLDVTLYKQYVATRFDTDWNTLLRVVVRLIITPVPRSFRNAIHNHYITIPSSTFPHP
jgi:hypothetical protein